MRGRGLEGAQLPGGTGAAAQEKVGCSASPRKGACLEWLPTSRSISCPKLSPGAAEGPLTGEELGGALGVVVAN